MAIKGALSFPGDKSISHRALMLASLANGPSRIHNLSPGLDVEATKRCLTACGCVFHEESDGACTVHPHPLKDPREPLDCRNSGTTTRLLLGLLAGQRIEALFQGDASLSRRPMKRVLEPLGEMGLSYESRQGQLPVTIQKSHLKGIDYTPPVASAQVKSALLLAGLGAEGKTTVTETTPTRDHTEIMLRELGASITIASGRISVNPLLKPLGNFQLALSGDPSSAAFFAAAALLVPQSELILKNVVLNPTRTGFFKALEAMGARIEYTNPGTHLGEKSGDLVLQSGTLHGLTLGRKDIPGLIDELPILAVLATQADGVTTVQGAGELRVKESDRITAICDNLNRMGANITELEDGFSITGPTPLKGTKIETYNDHRIAMAFTIAGLVASGPVTLDNPRCMAVSFPQFESCLKAVTS